MVKVVNYLHLCVSLCISKEERWFKTRNAFELI
jgi:hypothetical protein